jgi:hypothetical protein
MAPYSLVPGSAREPVRHLPLQHHRGVGEGKTGPEEIDQRE